ncbi:hypothetical protein EYC84_005383 [Monilinia fructicola]|uniref:Uncharacterized protein n=1 Tax=Monilinia fructicola TaxID=38448 RepID=A0A5M9K061_MONFR|nr:hypothetical protein EYC84_005383 [Monilinia fructicola]
MRKEEKGRRIQNAILFLPNGSYKIIQYSKHISYHLISSSMILSILESFEQSIANDRERPTPSIQTIRPFWTLFACINYREPFQFVFPMSFTLQ